MFNPLTQYRQTAGGDYDSRPKEVDVLYEMLGQYEWEQEYIARGHGEYVQNVRAVAAALSGWSHEGVNREIGRILANLQPVDR